jgi:hypothetical protein
LSERELIWSQVNLDAGYIELQKDDTKTMRKRRAYIPPNLLAYLRVLAADGPRYGPLVDPGWYDIANRVLIEMGFEPGFNAFRHSFASAWDKLVPKKRHTLSRHMGHSVSTLIRSYLAEVTVDWSIALFKIYPPGYDGPKIAAEDLPSVLRLIMLMLTIVPNTRRIRINGRQIYVPIEEEDSSSEAVTESVPVVALPELARPEVMSTPLPAPHSCTSASTGSGCDCPCRCGGCSGSGSCGDYCTVTCCGTCGETECESCSRASGSVSGSDTGA